ncbi:HlyD family type I secretion periplasmic adaptor subunit [Pantoea agglomerans]|uniref:HlyD family type I secretion periplasmic adaptor subunit n=1 Tax=Enterobacter agglomerans TaxID=549 RepID=UPI002413510B|nr:HlyD family type I secretion periplasmic adaptor subunit [Pantoea agglomerans]
MKFSFWRQQRFHSDLEFLPSALEILELPPSPVRVQLLYTICLLFLSLLLWSLIGKVDVVSTAVGKIQPSGDVKVVESAISGRISAIKVRNGDRVKAGDPLVVIDSRELASQFQDVQNTLFSWEAEALRRKKADEIVRKFSLQQHAFPDNPDIDWHQSPWVIPDELKERNLQVLERDLASLDAELNQTESQIQLAESGETAARHSVEVQKNLTDTVNKRATIRQNLLHKNVLSEDAWLEFSSSLKTSKTQLASAEAALSNAVAEKKVYRSNFKKTVDNFISDNMEKLLEAERQVNSYREKRQQLDVELKESTLTSPSDGVVAASAVTTVGQVVSQGQELMRIVPANTHMQVLAYVTNEDIGFIREGQPVEIKVDTFAFTRYGTLKGVVEYVSHDAISAADSKESLLNGTHSTSAGSSAQDSQSLVFPIIISLKQDYMEINNQQISLRSGMGVTAEVTTDRRRIISYILSPLSAMSSNALHER